MKKNIKLLSIFLLIIFAFTSCDTDATHGILYNIANSEKKEKFEIRAATFSLANNTTLYSVETQDNNGIYSTKTIGNKDKAKILEVVNYPQITNIYTDGTYLFFDSTEAYKKTKIHRLTLADNTLDEITYEGSFIEITSNGYIIVQGNTNYYMFELDNTTSTTTKYTENTFGSTKLALASETLSSTIVVDDKLILQTVKEVSEKYEYTYYLNDITPRQLTKKNNTIVAAHKDATDYYLVLDDGTLVKQLIADFSTTVYEPADDKKLSISKAKKLIVGNRYLFIIDQLNNVYSYDLNNPTTDYTLHTDGFANQIKYTSSIVELFEYDPNKYYIATNTNGYYKLEITDFASIDDAKMIQL